MGECVDCASSDDCAAGEVCTMNVCGECMSNADCVGNCAGNICGSSGNMNLCEACDSDSDCRNAGFGNMSTCDNNGVCMP